MLVSFGQTTEKGATELIIDITFENLDAIMEQYGAYTTASAILMHARELEDKIENMECDELERANGGFDGID